MVPDTANVYAIHAFAGGASWPLEVTVVDAIDGVAAVPATATVSASSAIVVCFEASLAGKVVGGMPWQLMLGTDYGANDGYAVTYPSASCIDVAGGSSPGTAQVIGTALGYQVMAVVTFVAPS